MAQKVFKKRKKIRLPWREKQTYIVPTRFGLVFLVSFLLMVLAGATYSNNMVFILAFLLFSFGLIAMIQTHRNLVGISILSISVEPGHASQGSRVSVQLKNESRSPRYRVQTQLIGMPVFIDSDMIESADSSISHSQIVMGKRGKFSIERVKVSTIFPYGLFYAWQYQSAKADYFIYPYPAGHPLKNSTPLGLGEDFSGHHAYLDGESQKHIDWKAFARGKPLLVKDFKDGNPRACLFDLPSQDSEDIETSLSQICFWILEAHRKNWQFGIRGDHNLLIAPGQGFSHLHRCLKSLAEFREAS